MVERIKNYNKEKHLELDQNSEGLTQQEETKLSDYKCLIIDYIFWLDR